MLRLDRIGLLIGAIVLVVLMPLGNLLPPGSPLHVSNFTLNLLDRKSTRLNSSHIQKSRMPSSA